MITWTVTTYTPAEADAAAPTAVHGAQDNRTSAAAEAASAALAALDEATAHAQLPYLSITLDDELVAMLAVGRDEDGQPDLTTAIASIHAALTTPPITA